MRRGWGFLLQMMRTFLHKGRRGHPPSAEGGAVGVRAQASLCWTLCGFVLRAPPQTHSYQASLAELSEHYEAMLKSEQEQVRLDADHRLAALSLTIDELSVCACDL